MYGVFIRSHHGCKVSELKSLFQFEPGVLVYFYKMCGMESHDALAMDSLRLAVLISLLLHAAVLLITVSVPDRTSAPAVKPDHSTNTAPPALFATIVRSATLPPMVSPPPRHRAAPMNTIRKPAESSVNKSAQQLLTAPAGIWAHRSWSTAERTEMDKFLNELVSRSKPPTGSELSQSALAMARQLGQNPQHESEDEATGQTTANGKPVEPFSLEMYFDAFVRKLNRSAAFVKNDLRVRGSRKALVQISLNSDGSLKNYRVLHSADQEAEIAYIKSVIDRASPFSAFPPDIRNDRDSLSILMCIYPAQSGGSGGFSRSFGAQDCRD